MRHLLFMIALQQQCVTTHYDMAAARLGSQPVEICSKHLFIMGEHHQRQEQMSMGAGGGAEKALTSSCHP